MNRFATRIVLTCCTVLLTTGVAAAKPGFASATVNLRAEANTTSAVVTKIPLGGRIDVGDCADGWCAVTYNGQSGFSIQTSLGTGVRRVARPLPGVGPNGRWVRVPPPGYAEGPVVYGPGPYYYGPGPYYGYGPYYGGHRRYGFGYGYGYRGWRRW